MAKAGPIVCSFCGRDKKEVKVLIAGVTGHICDVCISQAFKIVSEEAGAQKGLILLVLELLLFLIRN